MQTEKIAVNSAGYGLQQALDTVEKFAQDVGLDAKQASKIRLLCEETLNMVQSITMDFAATFWLERISGGCRIHLQGETTMNYGKKQDLIGISTGKKNSASVGIMDKIRDIIEDSAYVFADYGCSPMEPGVTTIISSMEKPTSYTWTMKKNRIDAEYAQADGDPKLANALSELEHSIVAKLADEIQVAIKGNKVDITVEKLWNKKV